MNNRKEKDIWLYGMVVTVLGLILVAGVVGVIALALSDQSTLQVIVASVAIGGLAGLLASSSPNRKG
jgi:uncharacterized membrane protein YbhN (UPF0104 family)